MWAKKQPAASAFQSLHSRDGDGGAEQVQGNANRGSFAYVGAELTDFVGPGQDGTGGEGEDSQLPAAEAGKLLSQGPSHKHGFDSVDDGVGG